MAVEGYCDTLLSVTWYLGVALQVLYPLAAVALFYTTRYIRWPALTAYLIVSAIEVNVRSYVDVDWFAATGIVAVIFRYIAVVEVTARLLRFRSREQGRFVLVAGTCFGVVVTLMSAGYYTYNAGMFVYAILAMSLGGAALNGLLAMWIIPVPRPPRLRMYGTLLCVHCITYAAPIAWYPHIQNSGEYALVLAIVRIPAIIVACWWVAPMFRYAYLELRGSAARATAGTSNLAAGISQTRVSRMRPRRCTERTRARQICA